MDLSVQGYGVYDGCPLKLQYLDYRTPMHNISLLTLVWGLGIILFLWQTVLVFQVPLHFCLNMKTITVKLLRGMGGLLSFFLHSG